MLRGDALNDAVPIERRPDVGFVPAKVDVAEDAGGSGGFGIGQPVESLCSRQELTGNRVFCR